MFFVVLLLVAAWLIRSAVRGSARGAAIAAFAASMLLPAWLYRDFGSVRIDLRTAVALVGVGCVALHPRIRWSWRPIVADFLVVGLVVVQAATEIVNCEAPATIVVDIAVQWLVPYLLGRIVWHSFDDGRSLVRAMAAACAVLACWSAVESVTRINPIGSLLGNPGSLQSLTDVRWGLRRAEGPLTHPIFFGMQLVLLFPFALAADREARLGRGPDWWKAVPWLTAAGAFCSMSRGPQLGIVITVLVVCALVVPRLRLALLPAAAATVIALSTSGAWVVEALERWSGEFPARTIAIRGVEYPYSGTRHRLLQLRVYAEAAAHAEWLGYGSVGLRAGETKLPHVEDHLRQMFNSIDNHYLQFTLQNGWLGLALFAGLCFSGIGYAVRATFASGNPQPWLAAATAGALFSLVLLLTTVWLASDFRFVLLATIGLAGGMRLSCLPASAPASRLVFTSAALRPSPGHPAASIAG